MPVPFRPAVFACPMRAMHGEKPKRSWPPPYPAWPEIADPSTMYTLPTVASHPAVTMCEWHPRWWAADFGKYFAGLTDCELIYLTFPAHAEEIFAKHSPTTQDILETAFDLLDLQALSSGLTRAFAAMGNADPEWSAFVYDHEVGHYLSFQITRPTIVEVNRIASGIFGLFKKLSVTSVPACENFWDEFQKRNDTLVTYLDKALILEELRANFYAFSALDPKSRASIEPDLRKEMTVDAIRLFDTIADITDEDWDVAYELTLLAEYAPADPLKRLHFLCKCGVYDYPAMLLDVANEKWDEPDWQVEIEESMYRTPKIDIIPPNGYAGSAVHHLSLSDVRELVFLESLRQQLAQFDGASLVCPFQQRDRTCCGFGHYLRAIWEQVRPEYRSAKAVLLPTTGNVLDGWDLKEIVVRPPRKACLHYGLG